MASCKLIRVVPEGHRPGWDVTCLATDDEGRSRTFLFYWPEEKQPDDIILERKFEQLAGVLAAELADAPDQMISKREVEALLVEKQLLKAGEVLADLKTLADLTAEGADHG